MDSVDRAAQVLVEHEWQALSVWVGGRCRCGWDAIQHMPHTAHQAAMIAAADLLAVREKSAALDQLAPGDRIWLDGTWREVDLAEEEEFGETSVYYWKDKVQHSFTAPAALLVRRAEP